MATITTSSDRIIITGATGSGDTYANRVELGAELYAAGLVDRYSVAGHYVYELSNTSYKFIEIGNGSTATHVYLGSHFIHWGGNTITDRNGTTYIQNLRVTSNGYYYHGSKNTSGSNTWYTDNNALFESRNTSNQDASGGLYSAYHCILNVASGGYAYFYGGKMTCPNGRIVGPYINTGAIAEFQGTKFGPGFVMTRVYEDDTVFKGASFESYHQTNLTTDLKTPVENIDFSSSSGVIVGASTAFTTLSVTFKDCKFGNIQNPSGASLVYGDVTWRGTGTYKSFFYNDNPIVKDFGSGQTAVNYVSYTTALNSYERRSLYLTMSGFISGLVPSIEIRDKNAGTTYADGTAMISEACQSTGKLGAAVTTGDPELLRKTGEKLLISKLINYNGSASTVAATITDMNPYDVKVIAPFMYKQILSYSLTEAGLITTQPMVEDTYVAPGQTRNSTLWTTISGYSTKFAVNYGSSTFTASASGTMQQAYDYDHYVNSQLANIQQTKFFTTANGSDFALRTGTTLINLQNLDLSTQRLSGGTLRYTATGTYSPKLGATTIDFSQAGTYNFADADFTGQITLTNSSGGNVTVELSAGVDYVNTGPNITIDEPQIYQSATISGLAAGTRIQLYDTTNDIEIYNGTPTFPYTWTDSTPYAADVTIRLRAALVSGTTAKEFIEATIGTATETSPAILYLANQVDDAVYNANAVNGSTVTGITFTDAATDIVNINISAGSVTLQSIYAAFAYWMFTESGIADDIAYVDAVDPANYRFTSMKIKNTSSPTVPLEITGGYAVDNTTGASIDLVDTTGGTLVFAPDHVVNNIVTVGGSNIITGDIDDVTAKVQAGLTAQGFTTTRAPKLDNLDAAVSTAGGATADEIADEVMTRGLATEVNATKNKNAIMGEL